MTNFIPKNDWPKTEIAQHFKSFACRIKELVHPEAQDIYRVHALSTLEKLRELGRCCSEVVAGEYPKKALIPVIEELKEALSSDPIVKIILSKKGIEGSDIAISKDLSTEELNSLGRLWFELIETEYRKALETEILRISAVPKERKMFLLLSKLYIAYLIGEGFHRNHIISSVETVFFAEKIGRCTRNLIERFFDKFPTQDRKFEILILGDSASVERAEVVFSLEICNDLSDAEEKTSTSLESFHDSFLDSKALHWSDGSGKDPFDAAARLSLVFSLPEYFNAVYPSRDIVSIGKECLVIDSKTKEVSKISSTSILAPVHSYTSQITYSPEMVRRFVDFSVASLRLNDDSYSQLSNSFAAAASALEAGDPKIQLVSIWSAFEALLPPPTRDENEARITHFVDLITPAVVRKFIKGKYRIFLDDLLRHSTVALAEVISPDLQPSDRPRRLFDILVENGSDCDRVFDLVSESPLMLNRVNQLFELSQNPKQISQKMESHENRVRWQLHRIYRERNSIVHAGRSSPALPVLVENAFLYYRLVVRAIQASYVQHGVYQPHGALQLVAGRYRSRRAEFQSLGNISDKVARRQRAGELIFAE